MNNSLSQERKQYIKHNRKRKIFVLVTQVAILIGFLAIWEILADMNVIDMRVGPVPALFSSLPL